MTKFVPKSRLHTLILLGIVCAAIIPAAVLGIASAYQVRDLMVTNASALSEAVAKSFAARFEEGLRAREKELAIFASGLATAGATPLEDTKSKLRSLQQHVRSFNELLLADPSGQIVLSDVEGTISATAAADTNVGDRPYFQQVLKTKEPYVQRDILLSRLTKKPALAMAAPVIGADGSIQAIVIGIVNIEELDHQIRAVQFPAGGRMTIADANGRVIVDDNAGLVTDASNFSQRPIWSQVNRADSGRVDSYAAYDGTTRIGGFATVPLTGWKVWFSETVSSINRQVLDTYLEVGIWVGLLLLAALAGAIALSRLIVQKMQQTEEVQVRLNAVMASTPNAILVSDTDGQIVYANPATEKLFGYQGAQLVGQSVDILVPSNIRDRHHTHRASYMANPRVRQMGEQLDLHAVRADGSEFPVAISLGFADLQTGRLIIATAQDLTALRERERSIEALSAQLQSSLETERSANARIEEAVAEITLAASSLASATSEILAATGQQASATAEEATAVRQTSATVAEVRQSAETTAKKARSVVGDLSQQAAVTADVGRRSVDETVDATDGAKSRIEALAERILAFSEHAQAISDINETVTELAEQSNLLAVNASIEAAKAGEAGKGFAVVASEVKELAERSKEATAHVRGIVAEIQKSAQAAVLAAEQGVKAAEEGTSVARRSGDAISALTEAVTEASEAAQQIVAAAEQQQTGMDQIALAMQNIEQSSAQTEAATRQVDRAAHDLDVLAKQLTQILGAVKSERTANKSTSTTEGLQRAS